MMTGRSRRFDYLARYLILASGLVLFGFAATELATDAIGLVSPEAMGRVAGWRAMPFPPGIGLGFVLTAIVIHTAAALVLFARRSTLRMSTLDAVVTVSGSMVPMLLVPFLVDTQGAGLLFGVDDDTLYRLAKLWPENAYIYTALIALLWIHGCFGIHQWLRLKPGYATARPMLALIALALPIAAIAGLIASARIVSVLMADAEFARQVRLATHWPSAEAEHTLWHLSLVVIAGYGVLLIVTIGALTARLLKILVAPKIDVTFVDGPTLRTATGPTLLDMSRINAVALADACGGRGRCTACSVRIERGQDALPPRNAVEAAMLGRSPSSIRLACQIRPTEALTVTRLTRVGGTVAAEPEHDVAGTAREVVAICVQMQGYAGLARARAAYDAIFLLNEFLDTAFAPISAHGGWLLRMTGSGVIAAFGRDTDIIKACEAAIAASAGIDEGLDRLNQRFAAELGRPVAAAIGLALGTVHVGRIGAGSVKSLTAIGPAIEAACGYAAEAEKRATQLLADRVVFERAQIGTTGCEQVSLTADTETHRLCSTDRARLLQASARPMP